MITGWINHPVTQGMLKLVEDLRASNQEDLELRIKNGCIKDQIELLAQLKGQIFALDEVLNTKEFLLELTEDGVINEDNK